MYKDRYGLSFSQEEVYVAEQVLSGSGANNILGVLTFKADLCKMSIQKSLQQLVKLYDTFSIRIGVEDKKVYQYFAEEDEIELIEIKYYDTDYEQWLNKISNASIFKYDTKLYKFYFVTKKDGSKDLLVLLHHLIADAWGMFFFVNTFTKLLYASNEIPKTILSYKQCIISEKKYLESNRFLSDKQFWSMKINSYEGNRIFDLGTKQTEAKCRRITYKINKELSKQINDFVNRKGISLNSLFIATLALYWSILKKTKNISVGMLTLGRSKISEKKIGGTFARVLPIILKINFNWTISEYLSYVLDEVYTVQKHYRFSLKK